MNKNYFEIKRAGINTTFQDQGRGNLYHIGIPFSGAMDNRNFQISNKLVGNEVNLPTIEFAYQGPLLKYFGENINFAITGDVKFVVRKKNNNIVGNCYQSFTLENDDELDTNRIKIPVCCDENFSLDIKRLEEKLSINRDKIYEKFFGKEFFCYMTGFIAGMPFLGDLENELQAKRLETPRVKVPKGSVGLTEQFANIYTFESPGGWNIIGNTPLNIFDSSKEKDPNLINPGDSIIFERITKNQYQNYNE